MKTSEALSLSCASLGCGYRDRQVLSDVSLNFAPGKITAILGPNGSGKSTLLKTLAGLIPPLCGNVSLSGSDLSSLSDRERALRIAYVPQTEEVPFRFTVRDIVTMGRLARSTGLFDTAEDRQAAERAMETADCLDLAARAITELSGGEKQRVMIARALAQEADILLLDEPTTHLDVRHQVQVLNLLRRLASDGKLLLAALHDLNAVSGLADFAVLLYDGKVGDIGPANAVLSSEGLDRAYSLKFQRIEMGGRLFVLPPI